MMTTQGKDRKVNTKNKVENKDKENRLPHERDESPDSSATTSGPRDVIEQAAKDLQKGLVDTDMRGLRGVEKVTQKPFPTGK